MSRRYLLLYIMLLFLPFCGKAQRVGVVFSGGGATGFAHIGVLIALEENDIPIDYITGTSAGALVGGLYASGFSPWQIRDIVLDEKFWLMSSGELEENYKYFIQQREADAELMSIRFSKDSLAQKTLPTNILNPTFLDLEMLSMLGLNPPSTLNSFDNLYVPFRCVASDIVTKESVMFSSGELNKAVRASMTYPFFISPIEVDGKLLFDGGLYNNFPAEEMYHEFDPDFIIGSNVSYNEPPPRSDDLMSQIKNMFSSHSNYTLPCDAGIIIKPDLGDEVGTFEFDKIERAIEIGYEAAIAKIDSIKMFVNRRVTKEERLEARKTYRQAIPSMNITSIEITGIEDDEQDYIRKKLSRNKERKKEVLDYPTLKRRYLRLYQSEHILSMFPTIEHTDDSTQTLIVDVKKEKPWRLAFGGHYSSRPVNTGFISASYSDFTLTPMTVYANTYFGKFYGSARVGIRFYLPTKSTAFIEPMFVMNRWDYFKSFATFFEDVRPSYIIQNERFWSLRFHVPTSSKSKLLFDFSNGVTEDNYYQTEEFTKADTADYTRFLFYSPGFEFVRSNLNRKQFESAGSYLSIKMRFVHGIENTIPGSTSNFTSEAKNFWNWGFVQATYKNYLIRKGLYRLGIFMEGLYSIQPFFQNYTASMISAHSFQPIPDSKTGFYNDFRANKYLAGGLMNVFTIKDKVDVRIEAYMFQPIFRILDKYGTAAEGKAFYNRFGIASASVIYHSPVGPLRATVNYFDSQTQLNPLSFQISFGYVIFNPRGIK